MSSAQRSYKPTENRLLSFLLDTEQAFLLPLLHPVRLDKGTTLWGIGDDPSYCYFPLNGMISLLSSTDTGETIEVGMIGNEGMLDVLTVLYARRSPYLVVVQMTTDAMKIKADALSRLIAQSSSSRILLLRYTHSLLCQVSQSAVCNRFHTVSQRLCRWLLFGCDVAHTNNLPFTHEFIAHMLGVPRTNVTTISGALQRSGLIRQTRGQVIILNHQGLEEFACECYRIIKDRTGNFLDA